MGVTSQVFTVVIEVEVPTIKENTGAAIKATEVVEEAAEAFSLDDPLPTPKKEPLKFEGEYDFDKANEEFKEVLEKLQKSSIESKPENGESDKSATELEEGEVEPATHDESSSPVPENFYDKKKSFFDTISCEATEKSKSGSRPRQDRN